MTIEEIISERDIILNQVMENKSFAQFYYENGTGSVNQIALKQKLKLLDTAINSYLSDDCGCGKTMRLNAMKSILSEIKSLKEMSA